MHAIWILLIGVTIVVGGVLLLRLHAFLALILAALTVGALTPQTAIEGHFLHEASVIAHWDENTSQVIFDTTAEIGDRYFILQQSNDTAQWQKIAVLEVIATESTVEGENHSIARMQEGDVTSLDKDNVLVVRPDDWKSAREAAEQTVGQRVALAFGNTCGKVGILIAMAAIIGKCLLDSGSADRIVRSALRRTGERGAPLAFVGSGFLLSIPVFFDTVFYLMIPLGKALHVRTGRNYLLYVLTIIAGGTMAHSLVPPTPGPLFVAEELGVDLGLMILAGCFVGLFSSAAGYWFAAYMNRHNALPLRESSDFSIAELKKSADRDENELPPLWLALLPILIPVFLIAGYTLCKDQLGNLPIVVQRTIESLGNKNIALAIAAVIGILTLVWHKRTRREELATAVQSALASGGVIILITSAGGALGGMMQQTGVAGLIRQLPTSSPLLLILLGFVITTTIRTAQGSATVAMITAVGILSPIVASGALGCHPVYLALSIGCGSKPLMWMNDSGFWVMCKMSGMTESEGLRFITPMTLLMALAGLAVIILGVLFVPL